MMFKTTSARALLLSTIVAMLLLGLATTAFAQTPAPAGAAQAPAPTSVPFTATGNGKINGTLVNKSANGATVANLELTLSAYQGSNDAGKRTTKADKDGKFTFDGLATGSDYTYQVSATFQNVPYFSEPVNFASPAASQPGAAAQPTPSAPATSTEQTVQIQVYDATNDESVIKSPAHHFLVEPDKTGITVSEIVIINNTTDKAYIGKESHAGTNSTLRFSLPEGAQNFQPVDGLFPTRVLQLQGGFVDTMPVYPGMSQKVWRYSFPATADAVSFSAKIDMPADKVSVLVPDTGAQVSVSGLTGPTGQDIQGEKYILFSGQGLAAGAQLDFKVNGLSQVKPPAQPAGAAQPAATASGTSPISPMVAGGVVGLVIAVIVAIVVVTRRQKLQRQRAIEELVAVDDEPADGGEDGDDLEAERKQLVATIARLDDLFEQDKIGSEEYGRLRTEKKRRLVEVVRMQKATVSAGREQ